MASPPRFPDQPPADHEARLNDPARLTALDASGMMETLPEKVFDRAVRLARQITGAEVSLFSLVDDKKQFFKAAEGLADEGITGTPLSHSFCQYIVTADGPLAVKDAREHALLRNNGAIGALGVTAYLGVPVHAPGGEVLGSFCAIDGQPQDWTEAQMEALTDIAGIVESEIALHQAVAERQLLVEELNHRVKNLFTLVSGLMRLSRGGKEPPEALEARITALARAHDLIAPVIHAGAAKAPEIALKTLLETLVEPYRGAEKNASFEGPDVTLGSRAATPLALAFHELATNAAKYGALSMPEGRLSVSWALGDEELSITWAETASGSGHLAAPTPGFGARLLSLSVESQLGGRIETDLSETGMIRHLTLPRSHLAE
ncbi:GAF domain-containing protein [Vannielia sp.]|uniref:GAF domain-containing protein n=1 Tax=Vannielia sp. TaxID=2813045 RepID=UPI00261C93CB|nr:GAF domain-containing protein [Vannielia sp.]MDF1871003.1 HWE histidine kinase domain-containing protein [Vannielia sp.]